MGHQLLQWKRVVVHGSCASDLRQSGRPDRPEACLYVKIGTVINVYPVGVPGAKKIGQNSLDWGAKTHISSTHRGPLHLTSEPLRNTGSKKKELLEGIMSKASVQIMTTLCVLGSRPRLGLARSPKRKASPCGANSGR